jgi:hypothetical protein
MRFVAWLLGLGVVVAFLTIGPGQVMPLPIAKAHLVSLAAVALWMVAAVGAGGALMRRMAPSVLDASTGWAHALVAGLLLWGLGGLVLGALGLLGTTGLVILALLLGAGWLTRPGIQRPQLPAVWMAVGAFLLAPLVFIALAPPTGTDALYYHLGVPAQMLLEEGLVGGLLHPQGSRPLILHLPYAALLHTGGLTAPAVLHLVLAAALLVLLVQMGSEHLGRRAPGIGAALLLLGSWTFMREAGRAGNDIVAALATLVALDAALRSSPRALGLAAGAALSIKYTSAGPLVGIFLVAPLPWRTRALSALGAVACLVPWWGRNLMDGLHPLFPFTGWPEASVPMAFQFLDKYGAGRAPMDFLLLPWRVFMDAEIDSFRFMGRLNPAWMVLGPFGLWAARRPGTARRLVIAGMTGAILWAAGPQWLRYLLPALPILALAAAAGMTDGAPRALIPAALLAGLVGIPSNWLDVAKTVADRIGVVSGEETADDFLGRSLTGYGALRWANAHLPQDARVAMLFSWSGALLERQQVLGSVEDHIPTRHWILRHGESSLQALADQGATHAVVRRTRFIKNGYPFLAPEVLDTHFQGPVRLLQDRLLMEGSLLAQDGPLRVYRLPAPKP